MMPKFIEKLADEVFGDKEDDWDESDKSTSEEIDLANLGISPKLAQDYTKRTGNENKKIFYGGKLTKGFFEWYLEVANDEQLGFIITHKLEPEFISMLNTKLEKEDLTEVAEVTEEIEKEESLIAQYIEKNGELIRENEKIKADLIALSQTFTEAHEDLVWLYELMSNEEKIMVSGKFTSEEIKKLESIVKLIELGGNK